MLPPERSPIHTLVSPWWRQGLRVPSADLPSLRIALATAMLEELRIRQSEEYDVFADHRVLWAAQYLNFAAGEIPRIDPDLHAAASWVFDPPLSTDLKTLSAGAA